MATLSTAARNAAVDGITAAIDTGSSFARGFLVLYGPGFSPAILSVFLGTGLPTFGAASGGVAQSVNSTNPATAIDTGTLFGYAVFSRDGVNMISNVTGIGNVGSGADIEMIARDCNVGQSIVIGTTTITMPAES